MRILQSSWQDARGLKLHLQAWEPDRRPRAVIALLHGLGEHVARYSAVAQELVKAGYAVMAMDLRGHGRSGGRRGHTPSYDALLDDVEALLARVTERYPRLPIFLYGHSLGGSLAMNYVLRRRPRLRGVIATAPWFRAAADPPALKVALAKALDPILPTYSERWGVDPASLSRDTSVGRAYVHDPLVHGRISVRMYQVCRQAGLWALAHAHELPLPVLLMHGTADQVTSSEASQEFARQSGKRVTLRLWEGWYHELHNEPQSRRVIRTMLNWMNRVSEAKAVPRRSAGQKRRAMRKSRPLRTQRV